MIKKRDANAVRVPISLSVPNGLLTQIEELAKDKSISRNQAIIEAIEQYTKEYRMGK